MRTLVRSAVVGLATGVMMISAAWAGVSFSPLPVPSGPATAVVSDVTRATDTLLGGTPAAMAASLKAGQLLVGAAKTSTTPRPKDMQKRFPGARWETDMKKCRTLEPAWFADLPTAALNATDGIANPGSVWPENPDCIYQGGFGIGPMNPVKAFDKKLGLWVRSLAMSDGKQTMVMTVVDGEGWLWDYNKKCTDCGAKQIGEALAADPQMKARHVTAASHILHATHSHASPDFIGGWGFVPNWYMAQVTDTIKATAKRAVMTMQPATLEAGEIEAREFNSERRDTYRSAEEQQLTWLRAVSTAKGHKVIATMGTYAAHPTSVGNNNEVAHPDWVGLFEKTLEQRFGGIGLHIMSGLGNMSNNGGVTIGKSLADLIPPVGQGRQIKNTKIKIQQALTISALTNVPLGTLGTAGLFDRKFRPIPVVVRTGEEPDTAPCLSASPQSIELPYTAARIGDDLIFTAAPGEVFSNWTNTIKEKNAGRIVFPMAQSNDALGYMPQEFEINVVGQQGLGFFAGGYLFVNYEDSYAVDHCTGDLLLEETLKLLAKVKA
ncbi:MAG: primase [Frankiales bacterium]|nr:primase [Frankiales bacterium]